MSGSTRPYDQAGSIGYPGVVNGWFAAVWSSLRVDTMGAGVMKRPPSTTLKLLENRSSSLNVLQIDSSLIYVGRPDTVRRRHRMMVDPHRRPLVRVGEGRGVVPLSDAYKAVRSAPRHDMSRGRPSLYLVGWGKESRAVQNPRLGHPAGRICGGCAFSRFG